MGLGALMESFTLPLATQFTAAALLTVCLLQAAARSEGCGGNRTALLAYSLTGGLFAGFGGVCVKTVSEMMRVNTTLAGDPLCVAFVGAIPLCLYIQMSMMMKGMRRFNQLQFVPCYQASILLGHLTCGAVYFNEFAGMTTLQAIAFLFGVGLVECGVLLLVLKSKNCLQKMEQAKQGDVGAGCCSTSSGGVVGDGAGESAERTAALGSILRSALDIIPNPWRAVGDDVLVPSSSHSRLSAVLVDAEAETGPRQRANSRVANDEDEMPEAALPLLI